MSRLPVPRQGDETPYALSVYRIEPGTEDKVRMLSDSYGGCITHYVRRSEYCEGKECPASMHRHKPTWKGYAAAEVHREDPGVWLPIVLEITEYAEQDLRGKYRRGQLWRFWRPVDAVRKVAGRVKHEAQPVQAQLLDHGDPDGVPPAFDVRPTLLRLYHIFSIDLSVPNPLPPRTMVRPSYDPLPPALQPKPTEAFVPPSEKAYERLRQQMKGVINKIGEER